MIPEYNVGGLKRNETYNDIFQKIGNSVNNIKIFNNFISLKDSLELIKITNSLDEVKESSLWNDGVYFNKKISEIINKYIPLIQKEIKTLYDINVIHNGEPCIVKWTKGKSLGIHADDINEFSSNNHIATLIYLNNDYSGGEITFPEHDLLIKPNLGDLIIFPGNINYMHEVKEIQSGIRYTSPNWFRFS